MDSFGRRLLLLLLVLGVAALVDWLRLRERATRWREYGFLLGAGAVGAVCGAGFDQVSLAIGPEYFTEGKGIETGPGFRQRVTTLGLQAGFLAGIVVAGVLMVANQRRGLALRSLVRLLPWPLLGALLVAAPGALVGPSDPLGFRDQVPWLGPDARRRFLTVWGLHAGLYGGAILGLVAATIRLLRLPGVVGEDDEPLVEPLDHAADLRDVDEEVDHRPPDGEG